MKRKELLKLACQSINAGDSYNRLGTEARSTAYYTCAAALVLLANSKGIKKLNDFELNMLTEASPVDKD